MKNEFIYTASLLRVIDGDTIEVLLDLGFGLTWKCPVRLAHIDAPEHNTKEGTAATAYLTSQLPWQIDGLVLKTYKPKDKYGRYLAEVYVGSLYINQLMIDQGHAKAYEGGGK